MFVFLNFGNCKNTHLSLFLLFLFYSEGKFLWNIMQKKDVFYDILFLHNIPEDIISMIDFF
jgi:hypothetical protein